MPQPSPLEWRLNAGPPAECPQEAFPLFAWHSGRLQSALPTRGIGPRLHTS